MVALGDDDPLWEQHSGGEGHEGVEWGEGDGELARDFYASLPAHTKFVFDLLMDRPGERLTSDWIAARMSEFRSDGAQAASRRSVASNLSPTAQPHKRSDRRLPFYWWRANGEATVYAMKPTVARLFREARETANGKLTISGGGDWSPAEVTAIVDDYLMMLQAERLGQRYSKAEHRRALLPRLNPNRTKGAVEFKHQNISAAMLDLGLPWIRGYKPLSNYQGALAEEISRRLETNPELLRMFRTDPGASTPPGTTLQRTPPPTPPVPTGASPASRHTGRHVDYGLLQEENRRRGAQGERLVAEYERAWLNQHGRADLASRVRWTSRDDGDGLGYDVLSFDLAGEQRYIEVKTTAMGADTPFYISSAELAFAQRHATSYALYRVYDVLADPRFFALEGDITCLLELTPTTHRARIASGTSVNDEQSAHQSSQATEPPDSLTNRGVLPGDSTTRRARSALATSAIVLSAPSMTSQRRISTVAASSAATRRSRSRSQGPLHHVSGRGPSRACASEMIVIPRRCPRWSARRAPRHASSPCAKIALWVA